MNPILTPLNPQQQQAVLTTDGAVLVLAGAGSGKTKALTHRVAYLLAEGFAEPWEILAVTFTNKAAKEMQERIALLLEKVGYPLTQLPYVSTFHSFGAKFLRLNASVINYDERFSILDDTDQLQMIRKIFKEMSIPESQLEPKQAQAIINHIKSDPNLGGLSQNTPRSRIIYDIFHAYEKKMQLSQSFDFSDLLLKTYHILKNHLDIQQQYQNQFKYILIDEFQDSNLIQYRLMQILSQKHGNICAVGDEDQSIYSWRGAEIGYILNFEKDFPNATIIRLEQNYRSTQTIVQAASQIISNNSLRLGKNLFTLNEPGDPIIFSLQPTEYEEARWVIRTIDQLSQQEHYSWNDFAILYRTNAQSRLFEEHLRQFQIPYKIVGGFTFFERMEIKDMLSYLRLINNDCDDISLRRIINVPSRGIGKTTLERLEYLAHIHQINLIKACELAVEKKEFNSSICQKIESFLKLIKDLQNKKDQMNLLNLYAEIMHSTGYYASLKNDPSEENLSRIKNLEELGNVIEQFQKETHEPTLQKFLEEMSLVTDLEQNPAEDQQVTLMTIHAAKGLEYPVVFVVGLEEGLFPSNRKELGQLEQMEEERRLFYVALTRARQKVYLSAAQKRKVWGEEQTNPISRFVAEIPKDLIKTPWPIPKRQHKLTEEYRIDEYPDDIFIPQGYPVLTEGAWVRHPHFGRGVVSTIEGEGEHAKIVVRFEGHIIRKFVARFAKLEILDSNLKNGGKI
ncbi:MAG: UvrD-helicase domain-containing protein [Bdellovibrionaceae bacterium]|nr:UvrD-helicase domain-containing protein [Pseudobdellovibrionaceae bacterium]MDW8189541.1 3'-5' exonuclease [Pseudobdellovibrionaceae bacterium]